MAALCAGDDAVGTDDDVAVEVDVHFQSCQDDVVQFIDKGTLVHGVGISACGDAVVVGVLDVVDGIQVKVLGIQQHTDHAVVQQVAHGLGQTADAEAHLDVPLLHDLGQRDGGGDGCAADTGLIGEAVLEVRGVGHDLGAVLSHHQLALVGGGLGCAGGDLLRDTDLVHDADVIHLGHGDVGGIVGEGHQAVGDGDHVVGLIAVHVGVAQNAAVGLAADAAAVAVLIAGGCADEGDVHMGLAGDKGADTAAVAAHGRQTLQLAVGDGLADLAADAGGLDVGDGAVLDHGDQIIVGLAQRAGADGDVLQAHLLDLFHDHADHEVAVTEVMMERNGHAVVCVALDEGLVDVLDHLVVVVVHHGRDHGASLLEGLAVLVVIALKDLFAGLLQDLFGNVSADSVDHNYKSPLYTPDALASSMVRFAPS